MPAYFRYTWDDYHIAIYIILLLLLLLSRFSHVQLCATPQMVAHQALPPLGFSRQEHWSGLPFPSPMHKVKSESEVSSPTLRDPMDCSLPGSSFHGIFQAKVLEWGAIAFSDLRHGIIKNNSKQIQDLDLSFTNFPIIVQFLILNSPTQIIIYNQ